MPAKSNPTNVLGEALRLHAAGHWVVPQDGKRAVVIGWDSERLSEDDLRAYLADGRLDFAIALHKTDPPLMDVETDSLEAEAALLKLLNGGRHTPTWQSKRGRHRLFIRPPGLPDRAKVEIDGIEFRIGNRPALTTLPPSRNVGKDNAPDGTRKYWLPDLSIWDIRPSPLPPKLAAMLAKGSSKRSSGKDDPVGVIPEGRRNEELFRYGCRLLRAGLAAPDVRNAIVGRNKEQCSPPLPDSEIDGIAVSIEEVRKKQVAHPARVNVPPAACATWAEVEDAWRSALYWRQDLSDSLAVMLAVAASTMRAGDQQLFLQVIGSPGSAKCLGKGTPVLMYDGSIKLVEDVVVGDFVMGPDSMPRRVLSTTTGTEEMFRVVPVKGDSYVVNKSHILSFKPTKVRGTVNMPLAHYVSLSPSKKSELKGWRTGVEWSARDVPLEPYFLGLWLGDGDARDQTITSADNEIIHYLRGYAERLGIRLSERKQRDSGTGVDTWRLNICWQKNVKNPIREGLRSLGVLGNKHIPRVYKVNSREVRMRVLAGLIDSDGTVDGGQGYLISTTLESLANDILFLARSLGLAAYKSFNKVRCQTGAECIYWRISISGNCGRIPVLLERKRVYDRSQIKNVLRTGIEVESLGIGEYIGFSLDGDGLFLLGDFTVTHNTRLCDAMIVSEHCYPLEHLTGFHSGWKGQDGEDCSLLSRVNGKCMITPEADVVMTGPHFADIMAQQRRIFDGTSGASYKNRTEDLRWTGLRTPWIMAGTPEIMMRTDQSRLGDRFIRVFIREPSEEERRRILRKAAMTEFNTITQEANCSPDSLLEDKLRRAYELTGGYVDWLWQNIDRRVVELAFDREWAAGRIEAFAEFAACLRARPDPDVKRDSHDTKELPARLTKQFVRLACCLAVVLNRPGVDEDVLRIVRKVAVDTSRGKTLEIARSLHPVANPALGAVGGATTDAVAVWTGLGTERCRTLLQFMRRIGVLRQWKDRASSRVLYALTPRTRELYDAVVGGPKGE